MTVRRREFIRAVANAATVSFLGSVIVPVSTEAQKRTGVAKIGFLYPGSPEAANLRIPLVREGLRGLGNQGEPDVEIVSLVANGDPDRLSTLAAELVGNHVNVIIAVSPPAVRAAKGTTDRIPIVAVDLETDPVASGWVASLAHLGGDVTGIFLDFPDFSAKCLQLLLEAVPGLTKLPFAVAHPDP